MAAQVRIPHHFKKHFCNNDLDVAEGVGFEPTVRSRVQRFSRLTAAVLPCIGSVRLILSCLGNQGSTCQTVPYRRSSFWSVCLQIGLQGAGGGTPTAFGALAQKCSLVTVEKLECAGHYRNQLFPVYPLIDFRLYEALAVKVVLACVT